jgi:hypothetical protein
MNFLVLLALAATQAPVPFGSTVEQKNFYLLSTFERSQPVSRALRADITLSELATAKRTALSKAANTCAAALSCYADAMKFSDPEIESVSNELKALYRNNAELRRFVDGPIHETGLLIRYEKLPGEESLSHGWTDSARAINSIIDVYGLGRPPRYPAIDSISYDVKTEAYGRLVHTLATVLNESPSPLFFQPSLRFALGLLDANHRDEAARFEPLESGENKAAIQRIATIAWDRFPYPVIVVPGSGNEKESEHLSAWGKLRLTLAVKRYREGKAPFILVSGGYVHPSQTAHCEAIEMKRSLMADFGIPEDAILIDPHARHTTTNLRDAARELYRYKIPFSKPGLITTDGDQSTYIEGAAFAKRCLDELGYQPALALRRISAFDLAFTPNIESLQGDARDPLDP